MANRAASSGSGRIFMLSEAAATLKLSATLVKNWTNGRPLRIRPSLAAHGTGSRNVYTGVDLYRLAIAARLNRDGFAARTIQQILDALGTNFTDSPFAIVTSGGRAYTAKKKNPLEVHIVPRPRFEHEGWTAISQQVPNYLGFYVLNIGEIAEEVNRRMYGPREGEAARMTPSVPEERSLNLRRKIRLPLPEQEDL